MSAADNARLASTVVATLARGGLRHVVLSPGSRNTPLVLASLASAELRCHVVLDERAAGFVALGLARTLGAPVGLLCTSGSAGAHYLPALIEARASGVPIVALTANRPPELHGCGAPQTIEQEGLFGAHVVKACRLGPAEPVTLAASATAVALAVAAARGPEPGPVHLDLAFREPLWEPGSDSAPAAIAAGPRLLRAAPPPAPEALDALEALATRERGVIVCGPEASGAPPGATSAFAQAAGALARRLGWPLLAEPSSGARFGAPEGAPLVASYDALLRAPAFARAHPPEAVLRFGRLPPSGPLAEWLGAAEETWLVDPAGRWLDPRHAARGLVAADPLALCAALLERLRGGARDSAWLAAWQDAERRAAERLEAACAHGLWEGAVARLVARALPPGALLHVGNSMPVRDLESFAPARSEPLAVTVSRGANGIDGCIATTAGAALAWPGPVTTLLGDLTFLHDLGGLAAAVALGVSATLVVPANGGGGIFEFLPIARHPRAFEPAFLTPQPIEVAAAARALGARYRRLETLQALEAALATPDEGLRVLEVPIDRRENVARHRATWAAVAEALEPAPVLP